MSPVKVGDSLPLLLPGLRGQRVQSNHRNCLLHGYPAKQSRQHRPIGPPLFLNITASQKRPRLAPSPARARIEAVAPSLSTDSASHLATPIAAAGERTPVVMVTRRLGGGDGAVPREGLEEEAQAARGRRRRRRLRLSMEAEETMIGTLYEDQTRSSSCLVCCELYI